MRVVLDTNVLISGIYFGGQPGKILQAWRSHQIQIVFSPGILEEYLVVAERLAMRYAGVEYERILNMIVQNAELIHVGDLSESVCDDADDDKFLACAVASGANIVVSGDQALFKTSGYRGVTVVTPKVFVSEHLE